MCAMTRWRNEPLGLSPARDMAYFLGLANPRLGVKTSFFKVSEMGVPIFRCTIVGDIVRLRPHRGTSSTALQRNEPSGLSLARYMSHSLGSSWNGRCGGMFQCCAFEDVCLAWCQRCRVIGAPHCLVPSSVYTFSGRDPAASAV